MDNTGTGRQSTRWRALATHELAHVELHRRLGAKRDQVPPWFDEGLAVLISDDRRYLAAEAATDRCLVRHSEALTVTRNGTERRSAPVDDVYLKGACVVARWVGAHGGAGAVAELIRRLSAGERFADVVTP